MSIADLYPASSRHRSAARPANRDARGRRSSACCGAARSSPGETEAKGSAYLDALREIIAEAPARERARVNHALKRSAGCGDHRYSCEKQGEASCAAAASTDTTRLAKIAIIMITIGPKRDL